MTWPGRTTRERGRMQRFVAMMNAWVRKARRGT